MRAPSPQARWAMPAALERLLGRVTLLGSVVCLAGGCGPSAPASVTRARGLVEAEADKIWRAAHPTVPSYDQFEFDGHAQQPEGGQVLKYTYRWGAKGGKPKHHLSLGFRFDAEGSLATLDVEDVVQVYEDTALVKPFLSADIVAAPLRVDLKRRIDALPDGANDELKRLVDQKLTAKGLVALWLKYKEAHREP